LDNLSPLDAFPILLAGGSPTVISAPSWVNYSVHAAIANENVQHEYPMDDFAVRERDVARASVSRRPVRHQPSSTRTTVGLSRQLPIVKPDPSTSLRKKRPKKRRDKGRKEDNVIHMNYHLPLRSYLLFYRLWET